MRAVVVALGDLGRSARMRYHARRWPRSGVDVDLVGFEGTPLPRAITDDAAHHRAPPESRVDAAARRCRASSYALIAARRRRRASASGCGGRCGGCRGRTSCWCRIRRRFRRWSCTLVLAAAAAACASSSTGTISATRCCSCGWAAGIRRCGWRAGSSAATRAASTRTCACRAGWRRFSRAASASQHAHVLYDRPASVFAPDRARRARAVPPGAVRAAGHSRPASSASSSARRAGPKTRTSTSSSKPCVRLEERIRGWEAARPGAPVPGSRDSRDRRRRAARRVRAALCRPAGAARSSCARGGSSPKTTRASSAAPTSGLCLHRSSSGLDIPMKVADLFGAGVPVCALDYGASLAERVRHGDNGLLFSTAEQLATSCSICSRRSPETIRRSSGCGPARASRRGRHGRKAGRAKPSPCCCPASPVLSPWAFVLGRPVLVMSGPGTDPGPRTRARGPATSAAP